MRLLVSAVLAAFACCISVAQGSEAAATLEIANDGTVSWDGARLDNDSDLAAIVRPYGVSGHRIQLHMIVHRRATFDKVAHVVAILQESDCCILGIVNTQRK
jgi:hypothetical protein